MKFGKRVRNSMGKSISIPVTYKGIKEGIKIDVWIKPKELNW